MTEPTAGEVALAAVLESVDIHDRGCYVLTAFEHKEGATPIRLAREMIEAIRKIDRADKSAIVGSLLPMYPEEGHDPDDALIAEMVDGGREWILAHVAEMKAEDERRASLVYTQAGKHLLDVGRTVALARGNEIISVVDGDILDHIVAIEREMAE